jgi:pimeloyl-ACP methyl ester carboxylesterase
MTVTAFATAGGRTIYMEEAGTGPALLALHGLGGGAYFFRGLAPLLASRYRTVAVDLPGTGRSSGTVPATMDSWIADLGALVRDAIREPVVVVGHSMGTILALKAWQAWPDWIRGLVFVGGLPEPRAVIKDRLAARAETVARHGLTGLGPQVSPANFSPRSLQKRAEVVGLFERTFETQDPAAYVASIHLLINGSARDAVSTVRVPSLSISGADDLYAPPDDVRAFAESVPGHKPPVVIPECGHLPFFEVPDRFAALVDEFLGQPSGD